MVNFFRTYPLQFVILALSFSNIPSVNATTEWITRESMPAPRDNLAVVSYANNIYVIGGTNGSGSLSTVEVYYPQTNTWATKTSMPNPKASAAAAVVGDKIYVVGGDNTTYEYNPATDNWIQKASIPVAPIDGEVGVGTINGMVFVADGSGTYAYDPSSNIWTAKSPINVSRSISSFAVLNGKLYAIGGNGLDCGVPPSPTECTRIDVYDPATDTWQTEGVTPIPTRRTHLGRTTPVVGNKIYVIGGWNGYTALSTVEVYDPETNSWSTGSSMPTARYDLGYAVVNDNIYAIGGDYGGAGGNWLSTNEELVLSVGTPPSVTDVQQSPTYPKYDEDVIISATVVDDTGLSSVKLYYSLNSGTYTSTDMSNVGSTYSATVPMQSIGTNVSYYIKAIDTDGLSAQSEIRSYTVIFEAPWLRFDVHENFYPANLYFDDGNVSNNHENYPTQNPPPFTVYHHIVEKPNYYVIEYWYYYAFNYHGVHWPHEHDFEWVFIWVNKSNNMPYYMASSHHHGVKKKELNPHTELSLYVANGSHGMAHDKNDLYSCGPVGLIGWLVNDHFDDIGNELQKDNFTFLSIDSTIRLNESQDTDPWYDYKTNEPGPKVGSPWRRSGYENPDKYFNNTYCYALGSPAALHIYDSEGRHAGVNATGEIENDIPDVIVYNYTLESEPKWVAVITNSSLNYTMYVNSTGDGNFTLSIQSQMFGENEQIGFEEILLTNRTIAKINSSSILAKEYLMEIDTDGDGVYEQNTTNTFFISTAVDLAKNISSTLITAPGNKTISISASHIDTYLDLLTNGSIAGGTVNISGFSDVPVTKLENRVGLYMEINTSADVNAGSISIRTYYSSGEVNASSLNESTLSFYNWDDNSSAWAKVNSTVNTVENYVLANLSHFSYYAIKGELSDTDGDGIPDTSDSCPTQAENFNGYQDTDGCPDSPPSGGGGGGGGGPACIKEGFQSLDLDLMQCVIKELNLRYKVFYRIADPLVPVFSMVGDVLGEWPAPRIDISSLISKPIMDLEGDAYALAVDRVKSRWALAKGVVVARGDLPVDGMAAVAYAKARDYPILLTKSDQAPSFVMDELRSLGVSEIIITGGPAAVSDEAESQLAGIAPVQRIWGQNREETAVELAKSFEKYKVIDTIVVTDGHNSSPEATIIASAYRAPIVYVAGDTVPQVTRDFLADHKVTKDPYKKKMKVVFVGVSEAVKADLLASMS